MKKHLKLLISLLQSIEKNTGQVAKSYEDNYNVDVDDDEPVAIPKEVYKEICKALDAKSINFMGLS